jgi:hypothetical protein
MPYNSAADDTAYQLTDEDWRALAQYDLAKTHRKRIVRLIFFAYWLVIFNGALRKWVLPPFEREIYFIGDPVVLLIYWLSIRYRFFRHSLIAMTITIAVAWLCVMEMMYHMGVDQIDLLLTGAGLRSYFLYVPLLAVIAETFERSDLERLVRQTLLLAIPVAVISIIQSRSPAGSIINAGIANEGEYRVTPLPVGEGIFRTTGTFTSNIGQAMFVGSIVAMLLWVWTLPEDRRPLRGAALLAVTAATLANVAVSGSRTIFALLALVLCAAFVAAVLMKGAGNSWNAMKSCAILAVLGALLGPALFPAQLHALSVRSYGAGGNDDDPYTNGLFGRALGDFVAFEDYVDSTPPAGYGIGQTSNAASILNRSTVGWSENEWQRHVMELGPILGLILILLRVALVLWIGASACIAARRHGDALGLLLFGFIAMVVLYFPVTSQGTITGYAWIFAGLCMAANKSPKTEWDL